MRWGTDQREIGWVAPGKELHQGVQVDEIDCGYWWWRVEKERKGIRARTWVLLGLSVPALLVLVSAIFLAMCWLHIRRFSDTAIGSPPNGTTYLLVGSDSRDFVASASDKQTFGTSSDSPGQHADVILLLRVSSSGSVRILPLPRDLLIALPDGSPTRLTMALTFGVQTLTDTICTSLGIGINHVAEIQMNGLRSLVNDVGGISIRVRAPERDLVTGLDLDHVGVVHLDGSQALAYVRSRHLQLLVHGRWVPASNASDERSGRAAQVLALTGARLDLGPGDPLSSAERLWELSGAISVDGGTSPFSLYQLGSALSHLSSAEETQIPVSITSGYVPTAELLTPERQVFERFNGGVTRSCSERAPVLAATGSNNLHPSAIQGEANDNRT